MLSISNITGAVTAFIRSLGTSTAPGSGEGILGVHVEDVNGLPLAMMDGSESRAAQYGFPQVLQSDENFVIARGDRTGAMALATIQPLFNWYIEGATVNTRLLSVLATTMASAQTVQSLLLNSTNINTVNTQYQVNTYKQLPQMMKAPTLMRLRARFTQIGVANASAEYGVTNVTTAIAANTPNLNGHYWSVGANGVKPVLAFNGNIVTEGNDVSSLLVGTKFYHWGILRDDDSISFTIQDTATGKLIAKEVIRIPSAQSKAFLASHAQPYVRVYNGSVAPSGGMQCYMSEWTAGILDTNLNKASAELAVGSGLGSEVGPLNYTTTSNLLNATVAPTTVPTNTTATTTTLDGAIRVAATAGAATNDMALFTYTVPAPYQYHCKGVTIAAKNLGAAVATTPTQIDYYLLINGNGVTMVGNTVRKYLGTQTFPVGAAIGSAAAEGPINVDFAGMEYITEAGRVMTLVARTSTGTATASQVIEHNYANHGYFE